MYCGVIFNLNVMGSYERVAIVVHTIHFGDDTGLTALPHVTISSTISLTMRARTLSLQR